MVLVCEHASRHIPLELQRLGLDQAAAEEHIAWDIGALALAEELSRRLDAPLLAAGYSRLLIDLNRPLEAPDSIPPHSEIYPVPGNRELSETVRRYRQDCLFHPFHQRLTQLLDERQAAGVPTRVVGVHSFTPVYHGRPRPLVAGVLYRNAGAYAGRILDGLRRHGLE
ncbi:N-formylglutamate amidohydrolase, partial [Pseudomonas aeruginosa]